MATTFISLCNQILTVSSPYTPLDASKKSLSTLLNEMTRIVSSAKLSNDGDSIIHGLHLLLLSDAERIRAASLRALRYSIHREDVFEKFLQNRLDYLVCRSLTIDLRNARERLEAYKFIRRLFLLYPQQIPHSFVYALDAIVSSSFILPSIRPQNLNQIARPDQMVKCSLELLCEIALQNPHVLQECNAINTMLKFIVDFEQDELRESVLYALLHAVDRFTINDNSEPTIVDSVDPNGPPWILVDEGMRERHELIGNMFSQLLAIFSLCEKGSFKACDRRVVSPKAIDNLIIKEPDKVKILKSCASALKIILQSWIGFATLCQTKNSSIRLLVNCLLVQSEPIKMIILDLFFDLLNLDVPAACDSYEAALKSMFPTWNLTTVEEGYTYAASEGADILPRLSSTRPNLLDSHMALILLSFIDAGLIEAVSELASNSVTVLAIRATLLLANFIWLCNEHLPEEQSFLLLPLLMDIAIADDDSIKRSFAREAMLNINEFFEYKQRTRYTYSFQLAQLIYHAQHINDYNSTPLQTGIDSIRRISLPPADEPSTFLKWSFPTPFRSLNLATEKIDTVIRDTYVLQTDNYRKWNWDLILALLKDFSKQANQAQIESYEQYFNKLCNFFKPESTDGFNDILLTDSLSNVTCRVLLAYSDLLIYPCQTASNHIKVIASNSVRELLTCVSDSLQKSIMAVREGTGRIIIAEQNLLTKNTVYYYLFLGRLSKSSIGIQALIDTNIFIRLSEMLRMDDEFATSAIVALSSFNYYFDTPCVTYLKQALKSSCTALRLYSTSLLRVILRANPIEFGSQCLNLLLSQLYDTNQAVLLEAASIFDEALEDRRLVNMLYEKWQLFSSMKNESSFLSDIYHSAAARLCSIPFSQISNENKHMTMVRGELAYWDKTFNRHYVTLIETKLFSAYSGGSLLSDDYFERRKTLSTNRTRKKKITTHVSTHLYRQLSLHREGFILLCTESRLNEYATEIKRHRTNCINVNETYQLKEALWALAHTASTELGYHWFAQKDLLADFLRFAEECQNLSVRGAAFYGLSLIAQTPDAAMLLKGYGWETYRVRYHSIPQAVSTTDLIPSSERRTSKFNVVLSPHASISLHVTPPPPSTSCSNDSFDDLRKSDLNGSITSNSTSSSQCENPMRTDFKQKRSQTVPSTILLNVNEKTDVRHAVILEESVPSTPTNNTNRVSFPLFIDTAIPSVIVNAPMRRCASISKDLTNTIICRDSGIASGATGSYSDIDYSRSPTYGAYSTLTQAQLEAGQSATDSLPLERLRPRSKAAHQSHALRKSKQLQKIPQVIQAIHAPTAGNTSVTEQTTHDELHRSRLLRCNFLLKPDAAGYEYARRVQKISHATYSHLINSSNNHSSHDEISRFGHINELASPLHVYTSKFHQKLYQSHDVHGERVDQFLMNEGKYYWGRCDLDDADHDHNTIYRGLAVPVDIRQVVEISDGYNLNYETWSDLVRSRSRTNTNADQARTRSATGASNSSGEFAPSSPIVLLQEQGLSTATTTSSQQNSSVSTLNVCMMCTNSSANLASHEHTHITMQTDFAEVKSLASRLIAIIHADEVEKKLLSLKESRPQIFDNICLYSEVCHILTLSSVRIPAQRFLHDLFSDCQFEKFRRRLRQITAVEEENDYNDNSRNS